MILENWTALEIIVGLIVFAGPAFAWTDRWIDRTRNKVSDVVSSKDGEE